MDLLYFPSSFSNSSFSFAFCSAKDIIRNFWITLTVCNIVLTTFFYSFVFLSLSLSFSLAPPNSPTPNLSSVFSPLHASPFSSPLLLMVLYFPTNYAHSLVSFPASFFINSHISSHSFCSLSLWFLTAFVKLLSSPVTPPFIRRLGYGCKF